jgi:hypothetical protein
VQGKHFWPCFSQCAAEKKLWAFFSQCSAGGNVWAFLTNATQGKCFGKNDPRFLGSVFGFIIETNNTSKKKIQ